MLKTYLKCIFIAAILMSCNNVTKEPKLKNQSIETINLREAFKKEEKASLSKIATKIEYLSLETNEESIIGTFKKHNKEVKFYGNNIFVNTGGVLHFSISGEFINRIGSVGRGPTEYQEVTDFTIIQIGKESLIAVYSQTQQKTFLYDFNGKFIKSFPINFWPSNLNFYKKKLVFMNMFGSRNNTKNNVITLVSISGEIEKNILYKGIEKNKDLSLKDFSRNYILNDTLHYWESDYDTIWQITKNFKAIPKYVINIGGNKMPIETQIQSSIVDFKKYSKYDIISEICETSKGLFLDINHKTRLNRIYYNKSTNESINLKFKRPFRKGNHSAFYNDIDGGVPFWPMGRVSDDKVFMIVYGFEMKDYIAKKGKNFDAIDKPSRDKLLTLIEKSKESDNPILMIVTLKK